MSGQARTGRPPLTERRKAATRLEVAREAVRLFTSKGVAATTVEEIAAAAGISVRTLWRYFPSKEACVWPLLANGVQNLASSLSAWPRGRSIAEMFDEEVRPDPDTLADLPAMVALVRLTRTEPALRGVWLRAHDDAESVLIAALARRAGLPEDDLRVKVHASMINSALRTAVEHHASGADPADLAEGVRAALRIAAGGLPR
jgi:AcrR family transcriptional regulator